MDEDTAEKLAVGEIVGLTRAFNPFNKQIKARVRVNYKVIPVAVDESQLMYIREKQAIGGKVAVGFYNGEWHLGIPPNGHAAKGSPQDIDATGLLEKELENIDIGELIGNPDKTIQSELNTLHTKKTLEDELLDELEKYSGYINWIEQYTKENAIDILEKLELSHLNINNKDKDPNVTVEHKKQTPAPSLEDYIGLLDFLINQNDEIILNQHEIIRLLNKLTSPDDFLSDD